MFIENEIKLVNLVRESMVFKNNERVFELGMTFVPFVYVS